MNNYQDIEEDIIYFYPDCGHVYAWQYDKVINSDIPVDITDFGGSEQLHSLLEEWSFKWDEWSMMKDHLMLKKHGELNSAGFDFSLEDTMIDLEGFYLATLACQQISNKYTVYYKNILITPEIAKKPALMRNYFLNRLIFSKTN